MTGIAKLLFPRSHALVPLITLRTLYEKANKKKRADYVHRARWVLQSVDALEPSVVGPRLQIRLAQFDSGSRLQRFLDEINNLAHFWWAFLCLHFPQNPPKSLPWLRKSVAMPLANEQGYLTS